MKTRTKVGIGLAGLVVVAGSIATMSLRGGNGDEGPTTVEVARGSIVQKALAIGNIEPDVEISVKSQLSGVVRELFVEAGDLVAAGDRLLEVKPNPTPIELADSKRQVELREIELVNMERDL